MHGWMLVGGLFSFGSKKTKGSPYAEPETLRELIAGGDQSYHLIDVRSPQEFQSGYIPTARHIPYQQIAEQPPTEDREALIIVYCESGGRSETAKRMLERLGYRNVVNFGGVRDWKWELDYPESHDE